MVDFQYMERYDIQDLRRIMALLRAPGGCPWDREQTHESIRRNMLEEAYEVVEAIDEQDPEHLKEELGDVLLQVVFHAQMAREEGLFTFDDVVDGVAQKMVFRHPHVFGQAHADDCAQALDTWDAQKREEKDQRTASDTLKAVARSLPALIRAEKVQSKAAKAGFAGGRGPGGGAGRPAVRRGEGGALPGSGQRAGSDPGLRQVHPPLPDGGGARRRPPSGGTAPGGAGGPLGPGQGGGSSNAEAVMGTSAPDQRTNQRQAAVWGRQLS